MPDETSLNFSSNAMFVIATSPLGIIMNVFSFYLFARMAKNHFSANKCARTTAEVSPCMLIYIILETCYSIHSFLYFSYLFTDSLIGHGLLYHAYFLWGFAAPLSLLMESLPIAVTFLSIERCLGIIVPFYMTKRRKRYLGYCSCSILFILASLLGVLHIATSFPTQTLTECKGFGCLCKPLGQTFYAIERIIVGIINTMLLITLAVFIKRKMVLPSLAKKTNFIVLKTLGILLIFDFFPHILWYVLYTFFDINITKPYGPFFLLAAFDAFLCSKVFRRTAQKHEIRPITLPSTT